MVSPLKLISRSAGEAIGSYVLSRVTAPEAVVVVQNTASATARYSRNEMLDVAGSDDLVVILNVDFDGRRAQVNSNRTDREGLAELVIQAETFAKQSHADDAAGMTLQKPSTFTNPDIYFDSSTAAADAELQSDVLRRSAQAVEQAGLVGAGELTIEAQSRNVMNVVGVNAYTSKTYGELSVTARTRSGKGSGWGWQGAEDFSRIDPLAITRKAIDLGKRSDDPVAVEPGRYTVIIEPEALSHLISIVLGGATTYMSIEDADAGMTVFSRYEGKKLAGNKLGLQMADRRVQLFCDPWDPIMPFSPLANDGSVVARTHWITNGVLENLAYARQHARARKTSLAHLYNPLVAKLEVSDQAQSLEEMLASTKRGIWIHSVSAISVVDRLTLLLSGVTRNGTFLIENGKVTRPVKNLRFSESPFFILNKIEAAGTPVRASRGFACPRLKVHDFEFTSLSDAI